MPSVKEFFFGKKGKTKQKSTLSPLQEQLSEMINQGLTNGEGPFKELFGDFDQGAFEEGVTKPALQNFQENILPQIQEKFIAGNQVLGSGMRRGQIKGAKDLQTQLATLMYEAQQKQQANKLKGIETIIGKQAVENIHQPGTQGAVQGFVQGVGEGAGKAIGGGIADSFSGKNAAASPIAG